MGWSDHYADDHDVYERRGQQGDARMYRDRSTNENEPGHAARVERCAPQQATYSLDAANHDASLDQRQHRPIVDLAHRASPAGAVTDRMVPKAW
jgi:hypothetical protein